MKYTQNWTYFDHNATTPISEEVIAELPNWLKLWGNPSSIHQSGRGPKNLIRESRQSLAHFLNVSPLELIFTSGASEANNTVIKSVLEQRNQSRNEFMCSAVEHPSVLKTYKNIENKGFKVHWIPVNKAGELDISFIVSHLSTKIALVSVMAANNETGNIFPIQSLVPKVHEYGALFHCDAVQIFGKSHFDIKEWSVDYATFSGHKFYALKGGGMIYSKKGSPFHSLIEGGAQERHRRGGTENVLSIASMGLMAQKLLNQPQKYLELAHLRDQFETKILKQIPGVSITGIQSPRISNTSHMMIDGVDGETLLMNLDLEGYQVSTGAACSSGNPEPSPVLLAMGFTRDQAQSSLRISLGESNTMEEIENFVEALEKIVIRLRKIKHGQNYDS